MNSGEKIKRYYKWVEVWKSSNQDKANDLEVAFYNSKINVRMTFREGFWCLEVPWIYETLAIELGEAFDKEQFDYPKNIETRDKWQSYDRYQMPRRSRRTFRGILMIGLALMLFLTIRMIYIWLM